MKRIPLSKNGYKYKGQYFAIVDDEDYEELNKYNWSVLIGKRCKNVYAMRSVNKYPVKMHIQLLGRKKGLEIDHINGNGLDNRKANLRFVTHAQNQFNSTNYSGSKGVSFSKQKRRWRSYINIDNRQRFIGYFDNKKDAMLAYNQRALELFGDYARLNSI